MKLRIKSTHTTLLVLGIYQIFGALLGYYIIASLLLRTETINGVLLLILLIALALYSLSMKAGSLLIRKEYKRGLILSLCNQLFQIISFGIGGYTYSFLSGGKLAVGCNLTNGFNMKLDFGLTSTFNMALNTGEEYFFFINMLAVFLTYIISDIYDEMFKKKKLIPESEITELTEVIPEKSASC